MPQRTMELAQGRDTLPGETGSWLDRIADSLYPTPSAELLQPHLIADGHLDRWVAQHRAIVREVYAAIVEFSARDADAPQRTLDSPRPSVTCSQPSSRAVVE